jgi:hypothetical protein
MSNYERSTRECSFEQLRPEFQQAFRDYFRIHENLAVELDETRLVCCETVSHKKEAGWLAALLGEAQDVTVYTAILLSSQALFWARSEENSVSALRVVGTSLNTIRVKQFRSLLTTDSGLEISGLIEGSKGVMRGYIGLGAEPEAQKFCEAVAQAVEKVNPKPAGKFPSWMGGR